LSSRPGHGVLDKNMKITLVGPVYPYRGGIAHYSALLARALIAHGHSVQVISFQRQYPGWLYPGRSDKDPSHQPLRTDAEYLLDPLHPGTWLRAGRRIVEINPDLVVVQWWTTFWAVPFAALSTYLRRKGLQVIYVIHNVLPHEQRFWDVWLAKLALGRSQAFIVQTEREDERLHALFPSALTRLCPHPIYNLFTDRKIPKQDARRRLGLPEDQFVLLFFGIVRPYKGLRYLLEALERLKRENLYSYLLVSGEIWGEKDEYTTRIEQLGLESQVRLDDRYIPDEEAAIMFSAADILVAPYIGGTQSGAAEMALGFGLPVIATQLVAAGLSTQDLSNVQVVPPGDVSALVSAIRVFRESHNNSVVAPEPLPDDWWRLVQVLVELREQIQELHQG
jgi:glycosyltransferase involved in cell wall biosynthesis